MFQLGSGNKYWPPHAKKDILEDLQDYMSRSMITKNHTDRRFQSSWYDVACWQDMQGGKGMKPFLTWRTTLDYKPVHITDTSSSIWHSLIRVHSRQYCLMWDSRRHIGPQGQYACLHTYLLSFLGANPSVNTITTCIYDWTQSDDASILDFLECRLSKLKNLFWWPKFPTNDLWLIFKNIVEHYLSAYIPQKKKGHKKNKPLDNFWNY